MMRSTRAGGALFTRLTSRSLNATRRPFTASAAPKAGILENLYLEKLKAYKPPPEKPSDAESHVQKFQPPATPKSPEEADLASEMKAYEDQQVEIEGQAATGESQNVEEDYFQDLNEMDKEEAEAHH